MVVDPAQRENKNGYLREYSYLWSLCALYQAANEIEKLDPKANLMGPLVKNLSNYYDPAPPKPGYSDYIMKLKPGERYYDDNEWIGITALDAYARKKQKSDLELGKAMYDFVLTGYDEVLGGGIYWKEGDKNSKNTCSNGPGVLVALQMYQATKDYQQLLKSLKIRLPVLPPLVDDPNRPQNTIPRSNGTGYTDTQGRSYMRSLWGAWINYDQVPLIVIVSSNVSGNNQTVKLLNSEGWAVAVFDAISLQPDIGAGLYRGIIGLVNKGQPRKPEDWGTIRAWSWGLSKALDYLQTEKNINSKQIGIQGHSRWGKTAMLATAMDTRWAVVFS
ncbi:Glycosyl hydrolase family 76 [Dyadobacter soli]|uniref:Glycosyl hydrolase family 76 n=1 Tax=Dyadobacter soli TaxID=659014 RepID=A0A1G8CVS5_9BACT|nr:glycoside hydrolase family 76 protein [Dyadobacter soli]SDH49050.1 Glycosyl hydrolase family 76 [Dyadobacter soli]